MTAVPHAITDAVLAVNAVLLAAFAGAWCVALWRDRAGVRRDG